MTTLLELDGAAGEGGGQILRTALSLSMCSGRPFRIVNIRARRKSPGLMRQHLTAVRAAAEICRARVEGDQVGSLSLSFAPGPVRAGDYRFAIGTAGSCSLVFQTLLPALLQADGGSRIRFQGGTHNPLAPPFHFLDRAFLPLLRRMGAEVSVDLRRFGFYPAGGGEFGAAIEPVHRLAPLVLERPGARRRAYAEAYCAALPIQIARRELDVVGKRLGWGEDQLLLRGLANDQGPGNVLVLTLEQEAVSEVFTGFGEKGVTAEAVAQRAVDEVRDYLASAAAVGPHLADQLLLPLALSGAGSFTASALTRHTLTNAEVIRSFLGIPIATERLPGPSFRITVGTAPGPIDQSAPAIG